jgi:hypothetical protein
MGERSLRRLRIIGANSVIIKRHVHAAARPGTWLGGMLTRKPPMFVRVALANKGNGLQQGQRKRFSRSWIAHRKRHWPHFNNRLTLSYNASVNSA